MKVIAPSLLCLLACASQAAAQTASSTSPPNPSAPPSSSSTSSASSSASSSPAPVAAEAPAGVGVVKFSWERIERRNEWDSPVDSAANQTLEDPRASGPFARDVSLGRPNPVGRPAPTSSRDRAPGRNTTSAAGVNEETSKQKPLPGRGREEYVYRLRLKNESALKVESIEWDYLFFDPETKKELGRHRFVTRRRAKPGETFTVDAPSASPPARVVPAAALGGKRRARPFDERVVVRCVAYADGTFARRAGADESDCEGVRAAAASRARGGR